jgi:hypothetical protein
MPTQMVGACAGEPRTPRSLGPIAMTWMPVCRRNPVHSLHMSHKCQDGVFRMTANELKTDRRMK